MVKSTFSNKSNQTYTFNPTFNCHEKKILKTVPTMTLRSYGDTKIINHTKN